MQRALRNLLILLAFALVIVALFGGFARLSPGPVAVEIPVRTPGPQTVLTATMVTPIPTPAPTSVPPTPALLPAPTGPLVIHFLAVGAGDSVLIETPRGRTVLLDAGPSDRGADVLRYLRAMGVTDLDLLIASHAHADQVGGMPAVIAGLDRVGHFLDGGLPDGHPAAYERLLQALDASNVSRSDLRAGQRVQLDPEVWLDVLNPPVSVGDQHEDSLVLRLVYNRTAVLLTGGLGPGSAGRLLDSREDLAADVLQVPRQGEPGAASPALLERVRPRYAVVSTGDPRVGTVDGRLLANLLMLGTTVYLTNSSGTVAFTSDGTVCRTVRGTSMTIGGSTDVDVPTVSASPTPYRLEPPYPAPVTIAPTLTVPLPSPTALRGEVRLGGLDLASGRVLVLNAGAVAANLSGWRLTNGAATRHYQFPTCSVAPGGSVVVQVGTGADGGGVLYWNDADVFDPRGDRAYLHDSEGHLIDGTDGGGVVTIPIPVISTPVSPVSTSTQVSGDARGLSIEELDLDGEWVRLRNAGTSPVELTGWYLTDDGANFRYDFGGSIAPGAAVTVYSGTGGIDTDEARHWYERSVWNDEGDAAHLYDPEGSEVSVLRRP